MKYKKVTPLRKPGKEMEYEERVKKFDHYYNNPKEFHKIFTELGFTYVDDGCDGYCPECEKRDHCETYEELKDDFKDFTPEKPKT